MEEKKLTDEEIIQSLKCCSNGCRDKSCFGSEMDGIADCTNILTRNALTLIQRLQDENKRLMERVFDCTAVIEYNEKCSKEIQAATILLEQRNEEIAEQKAEIERLTEELEAKKKECREIADDYQEMDTFYYNETVKTAELQKQVNELKKYKDFVDACKLGGDIEIVMNRIKPYAVLREKAYVQAVKDTTKEILQEVGDLVDDCGNGFQFKDYKWHRDLCKRYGVEVE